MRDSTLTILCLASYEKGFDFMREAKNQNARVILLTSKSLENVAWPKESIDEIFYLPDNNKEWNLNEMISGVSFIARKIQIDRIVALDDFDVEKAAMLREHLRVGGMGDTTARYFRDKLAMRTRAAEIGIKVPPFVHILNYDKINRFLNDVEPPYILKPRMQAGAIGLKKINTKEELWQTIDSLGDKQSFYLLEKFIPGTIYHVDSIVYDSQVKFSIASQYALPPMEVAHEGRVFCTRTMMRDSEDEKKLQIFNKQTLTALGLVRGVSHSEYIKGNEDGAFYFLETSARVGGANIAELVEAATGLNLWREWAKIEVNYGSKEYVLPQVRNDYAGLLISLAKQEYPDLSSFNDAEVNWKMKKAFHAGIIVKSESYDRITELLTNYTERFYNEFFTSQPLKDKPSN